MSASRLTCPDNAARPGIGIVHLGLGAFFRAHAALYIAEAMQASGGDWGITGVSLRRAEQRDLLAPQGCAYYAAELGPGGATTQLVTVIQNILVAQEDPKAVIDAMAAARIVSLTITEKGYCHSPATGRLDFFHPDVLQDLQSPDHPGSAIGYICRALDQVRQNRGTAFTVLSCDNLPNNGHLVRGLVLELAERIDPSLAKWIDVHATFPSSMVDRIVPATTPDDIALIEQLTGAFDAAPVMHEPFRQWVIEDNFVDNNHPDFTGTGVELVADVTPYEHMKLRCLNGTHSALAYLGYLGGAETIADMVARPGVPEYLSYLWEAEILPVLETPPGADLSAYARSLLTRYENPGIRHRTWQIAMDGSQKLPQRILGTISENLAAGRIPKGLMLAVAAWMRYVSGRDEAGQPIDVRDPMAAQLARCWQEDASPAEIVSNFLAISDVFPPDLAENKQMQSGLIEALELLLDKGAIKALAIAVT